MATQVASMETEWVPAFGFGDRLRVVRRRRRRSQDEMAAILGVKKTTYSAWESGRSTPSLEEIQAIARRLNQLDRVPQWWTLGADQPTATVGGGARSSTDRASDYGSEGGHFSRFRRAGRTPRHYRRKTDDLPPGVIVLGNFVADVSADGAISA